MPEPTVPIPERSFRSNSRLVGLYHALLRQQLDHFFPDSRLRLEGDHSPIHWNARPDEPNYHLLSDPDGLDLIIDWFGSRYVFQPVSPVPLLSSERRLVETIVRVLDLRFRTLIDIDAVDRTELFDYALEDVIVTEYLNPPAPMRLPVAMEAMRMAALSTYEDRRVSSGALLLGTETDPAFPDRTNAPDAPRYNVRLTSIKIIHRLCDGLRTVFVVDRRGDLAWAVDIERWTERVQGHAPLPAPCPRRFEHHARATRTGDHVGLVLSPSQEIKVFAGGVPVFTFANARWRLLDVPNKFASWTRAVGDQAPPGLAARLFQAAMNLSEDRVGALIVLLRDPEESLPHLVAPGDRIEDMLPLDPDAPADPDHLPPRMAKRALHHLIFSRRVGDLDASVLEAVAGIDGAVVVDRRAQLLAFGAILRITPEAILAARASEGARTVAALAASYHGPVLKVSQDGVMSMFLGGRRVWEL
ncbi:diadenylate cyclase [Tautonia rosea]|uniref:diadenylate cyclase n=1 Tax=Tautonia rosea TaxID=2728037 RepID=UPI001475C678|nr:diadenylate cyclase [Tautonia rosea]